jgi:probable rRNA maturation factor
METIAKKILKTLGKENTVVEVHLVTDEEIRKLNKKHRGKDRPTNVLSFTEPKNFPHPELGKGKEFLGEVYLAPNYIKEKGEDKTRLLIHGILHLVGYTHGTERDRIRMEKKEEEICQILSPASTSAHRS